jgi:hypothetical protein
LIKENIMSASKDNKDAKAPEKKPEESEPGIDDQTPVKTLDIEDIALLKRYVRSFLNYRIINKHPGTRILRK